MLIGKVHVNATLDLWNQAGEVEMIMREVARLDVVLDSAIKQIGKMYVGGEFEEAVRSELCAFIERSRGKMVDLVDKQRAAKGK